MYDLITIGSSLIDIFIQSTEFSLQSGHEGVLLCQKYGDKIELDNFEIKTGGGGSNTAVAFARAGFHTAIITETGQDVLAELIMEDLHRERVATNLVIQEKKERTGGSVILIGQDGGRTVMVHRGAASMLDAHDIPRAKVARAEWVHLSSIAGNLETLTTIFQARTTGALSWNPGKQELHLLAEGLLPISKLPVEILFLNQSEWRLVETQQSALRAQIPQIVVTAGQAGGHLYSGERELAFASSGRPSFDDTGAGDAFASGFVAAYLKQWPLEQCLIAASRNAESVIQTIGAKTGLLPKSALLAPVEGS